MTQTVRFALPLLEPGQAQKEMFHNEALVLADLALHAAAETVGANTPPEAPLPGQCWIIGAAPTGDWVGQEGAVAGWTPSGWRFLAPREGLRVWLGRENGYATFADGQWRVGDGYGPVFVGGKQVVGHQFIPIAEPMGGSTVDAEARATIISVLDALRAHGLIEPE